MVAQPRITIPEEAIKAYCHRWGVKEFALFGSVLTDRFNQDSDVDVLVEFLPGFGLTFENFPDAIKELEAIFGREVDLVEKDLIRNPFRRYRILTTRRVLYAA